MSDKVTITCDCGLWHVEDVSLTGEAKKFGRRAHYKFWVRGMNFLAVNPEPFFWSIRAFDDYGDIPRWCLVNATIEPDAAEMMRELTEVRP